MMMSQYAFLIVSALAIQFSAAHADIANTASQDLAKLVSGSGKVVFLRSELVPATSISSIYDPDAMSAMTDVIYQGSSRFVNHGDSSIDLGKLSCDVQYSNSRTDTTFQQPLVGSEIREGVSITGIDAFFQAGQAIAWDAPTDISEAVSYSLPMGDLILRGIHLNFYSANSSLIDIDCSETVSRDAPQMAVQDFEQATGGLMTIQAQ